MTGIGHLTVGAASSLAVVALGGSSYSPLQLVIAFFIGTLSALLPDLDAPHSILKDRILANGKPALVRSPRRSADFIEQMLVVLAGVLEVVLRLAIYALLSIPSFFLQHRALTHYLITPLIIWFILIPLLWFGALPQFYGVVFFVGYLSHLAGDMLTYSGVAILSPFYKTPLHLLPQRLRFPTWEKKWEGGVIRNEMSQGEKIVILCAVVACLVLVLLVTKKGA